MTAQPKKELGLWIVFLGLCAVAALAPLPFGLARPLAWDAAGLAVALLLLAFLLAGDRASAGLNLNLTGPACLFGVVIALIAFQTGSWVSTAWWNPLWGMAADTLGMPLQGSVTIDRYAAWVVIFRLSCYAGTFFLAFALCQNRDRAHLALKTLAFAGTAYAIYGLFVYWTGNKTILWFHKWTYTLDLTGPFVNRNSFATYLGLSLVAMFGLFFDSYKDLRLYGDRRARLKMTIEFVSGHAGLVASLFILSTALILTHSRAGNLSTLAGVFALIFVMAFAPSLKRYGKLGWIVVTVFLAIVAFFISGAGTLDRFLDVVSDGSGRLTVYQTTLQAIADYPVFGTGAGSFADIFPVYRPETVRDYYDMTHDDYLQNMLELGIPASLCFFAAVGWLIATCLRGVRIRQRDAIYPCVAVAATVLVGLHATVDFSLQIPAVTITYMVLLGIGVAQSRSSRLISVAKPIDPDRGHSEKPDSLLDQSAAQP